MESWPIMSLEDEKWVLSWILVDFSSQIVLGTKRCQKPLQVRFHDSPFQCSVHGVCGLASVCVFFSLLFAIIYLFCFVLFFLHYGIAYSLLLLLHSSDSTGSIMACLTYLPNSTFTFRSNSLLFNAFLILTQISKIMAQFKFFIYLFYFWCQIMFATMA